MPKQESSLQLLNHFLPPHTFRYVISFFQQYTIHLTLTHDRRSVLGDYRPPTRQKPQHRISVNASLNPWHFLITLLHEIAHLETFAQHGARHQPHGSEWKDNFRKILQPLLRKELFPEDIALALHQYLENPAASTCTDPKLYKALHQYNPRRRGYRLVDDVPLNALFETENGQQFIKVEKLRTRSRCRHVATGRMYFFQGIVEVKLLKQPQPATTR